MIFKTMAPGSAGIGNIPLDNSMKQIINEVIEEETPDIIDEQE